MRVVVADATPLNYLILIGAIHVLPRIFEKIHVPIEIRDELSCEATPPPVRTWMQQPPHWLEILVAPVVASEDSALLALDAGERAAIVLAESIRADLLLIDDRAGAILAQRRGLAVTGTLGVLDLASQAGLLHLHDAFVRLQKTKENSKPACEPTFSKSKPEKVGHPNRVSALRVIHPPGYLRSASKYRLASTAHSANLPSAQACSDGGR
jgi:predicted nucleic acid-binding protein